MYLKPGSAARLTLKDGSTVEGVVAHSRRWGVHRLNKVRVFTRVDPVKVAGHFLVSKHNVLFVQVLPPELAFDESTEG